MEQIIYADVLFIVNFSMDFLALYITSKLLHNHCNCFALLFSSGIGGVYGVVALVASGNAILNTIINIAVAFLMCFILFGIPSILAIIRNTLTFYGISFLIGGTMTAIYYLANKGLNGRSMVINGEPAAIYTDISPLTLILTAFGAVIFSYVCSFVMKRLKNTKKADVEVEFNNNKISFSGICDTGNLLCDPISSLPCIVCNLETMLSLVPKVLTPLFRDKNVALLEFADPEIAKRIRIIPMKNVGGSGIILGIIPDKGQINGANKKFCLACDPESSSFAESESIIPSSII